MIVMKMTLDGRMNVTMLKVGVNRDKGAVQIAEHKDEACRKRNCYGESV